MKISKTFIKKELIGFSVLFAGSFLILFLFDGKDMFNSLERLIKGWSYGFVLGLCFWQGNEFISGAAGRRLNWRKNAQKANTITILLIFIYGLIISIIIPFVYYKYVFQVPSNRLIGHILGSGFVGLTINFIIVGAYYSQYLAKYWMKSIQSEEKLKQESLMARYEALKNQVNPHFLFNSLNTLTGIVEKDQQMAIKYIKKLADIYRYVLEQKEKETVKISEELEFINDFIYLQKMRHGEGLIFKPEIETTEGLVAPLSLQILVENAIKHNVVSNEQPLLIELKEDNEFYILKNNLQKRKSVQPNAGTGLENLIRRYEYLTEKKPEIIQAGDEFIVKLPKIEMKTP
ncbi:MAG: sensor histidine kinase [Bacteroidales bacterium]|nr:sensor histidine kinase [Bacteroidales bacterium]